MRKRLLLILAVIAGVTVSLTAYYRTNTGDAAPRFVTAAVTRGDVVEKVEATGTLAAVTTVQVGTQISGTIKSLHADYNSVVKRGQVIAELEPSLLQTQVEQAQASMLRLEADADRARLDVDDTALKLRRANELWAQQLIPKTDLETAATNARQAESAVKSAQAQIAQARAVLNQNQVNLGHAVIAAPIDGIVISRSVDVGQTVAASMSAPTLFVIAKDLREMQVNASIDEADIGRIAIGQPVEFRVDAYPNDRFSGKVSQVRLEPKVDSNVVSYMTIIDVPNPDLKLKPGMTATVTVEVARADDVLKVPTSALRFRGGASSSRVFVLQDGQPTPVKVRAGISDGAVTAILSGDLTDDVEVITAAAPSTTAAAATTGSPLLPFGGRGRQGGQGGQRAGAQGATGTQGRGAQASAGATAGAANGAAR